MRTIYKYELAVNDTVKIEMPKDAQILTIQKQSDRLCIWAIVETDNPLETRVFFIVGTGHPLADNQKKYIASVQDGSFMWHVFELITKEDIITERGANANRSAEREKLTKRFWDSKQN